MSSPSFETTRTRATNPTLDARICADIGQRLARIRAERGLTIADLTSTLLLSARQVRALEEADASAFHNASFFMIALRKYAALCGVARDAVDAAVVAVPEDEQPADDPLAALRDADTRPRDWTPILAILGVCAIVGAGWGIFHVRHAIRATMSAVSSSVAPAAAPVASTTESSASTGDAASTDSAVSTPTPAPTETTAPPDPTATAPPGEVPAAAPPSDGAVLSGQVAYGSLWSPERAWMFLRMDNGTVIERTVSAGELVQLPSKPRYLAIGTPDAELTIGITPVDVTKFVQKGTLRMGVSEFGQAEQSALGGSTSEPDDNTQR